MPQRALITGITGQDGSYLAELLLERGYEVHGLVRRASTERFDRIEHVRDRLTLHQGDLLDQRSLVDALRASRPDEVYNLAAMSFVAVSWIQPTLTAEFTGVGVTRMLDALREACPDARFYQASSSEMFGKVRHVPQDEETPFYPRSPYGVAKAYGHFITVNYRESYDLHATSGILFNHECVLAHTPLLVRERGMVAVRTPADLVAVDRSGPPTQSFAPDAVLDVWDGADWTALRAVTATRRRPHDPDHEGLRIQARHGIVDVTAHHHMLDPERRAVVARDVAKGSRLATFERFPAAAGWTALTPETAELLGRLTARGAFEQDGTVRVAAIDPAGRARVAELWSRSVGGTSAEADDAVVLRGGSGLVAWLREQLFTPAGLRQVPPLVLNATAEAGAAFLAGYDDVGDDALRRSLRTDSAVLTQGICWLHDRQGATASLYVDDDAVYQLDPRAPAPAGGIGGLVLPPEPGDRVRRISPAPAADWVYDLETESGVFGAGVGRLVVHNSPRRGLEFVTRKITWHAAAIKYGLQSELRLGNLDAQRDWGYARDYVEAMHLMLQQDEPEDFVIATGRTHSVRDCVRIAFDEAGLGDYESYVTLDPAFLRPAEIDLLIGDPGKAKRVLGWEPQTTFEELIRLMTRADLELLRR